LLPAPATVAGAEDTALAVRAEGVPQGGDVGNVGVFRMHAHAADEAGIGQAKVRPGLAGIGGTVDAVAVGDVAADAGLSHAGIDDVRVRLGDGDGADGGGAHEAVGDVLPVGAAVGGLPHAAG